MRITSIKKQDRRSRWSVYVDDKYAFSLSEWQYATSGLKRGQELTGEEIKKLKDETEFGKLYDRVLKYIGLRPHSEYEIDQYLAKKSDNEVMIERAKGKLTDAGYVNDESFAKVWVENRTQHKLFSNRRLRQELLQKRIDKDIIDQVLKEEPQDEIEVIKQIIAKKGHRYSEPRKLQAYLARQGFSYSSIKDAMESD